MAKKSGAGLGDFGDELSPPVENNVPVLPDDSTEIDAKPINIRFRMTPADWKKLKNLSMTERRSMQKLLEDGINELLEKRGLQKISGISTK